MPVPSGDSKDFRVPGRSYFDGSESHVVIPDDSAIENLWEPQEIGVDVSLSAEQARLFMGDAQTIEEMRAFFAKRAREALPWWKRWWRH